MEKFLFEIPVYLRSFDRYQKESDIQRNKYVTMGRDRTLLDKDIIDRRRIHFEQFYWKPWRYNDIIAWIRLKVDIKKISAEVHCLDSKKLRKDLKNKTFRYSHDSEVSHIDAALDSNMIARKLIDAVDMASKQRWIKKKYFVDRDLFDRLVKHVDWKKVIYPCERLEKL